MERLQAVDIASSYGKKKVLCGVNITADAGQCVGIVGTNGCGKSTLFEHPRRIAESGRGGKSILTETARRAGSFLSAMRGMYRRRAA